MVWTFEAIPYAHYHTRPPPTVHSYSLEQVIKLARQENPPPAECTQISGGG